MSGISSSGNPFEDLGNPFEKFEPISEKPSSEKPSEISTNAMLETVEKGGGRKHPHTSKLPSPADVVEKYEKTQKSLIKMLKNFFKKPKKLKFNIPIKMFSLKKAAPTKTEALSIKTGSKVISECINILKSDKTNINTEGLFRLAGKAKDLKEKEAAVSKKNLSDKEIKKLLNDEFKDEIHNVSSLLKKVLKKLPIIDESKRNTLYEIRDLGPGLKGAVDNCLDGNTTQEDSDKLIEALLWETKGQPEQHKKLKNTLEAIIKTKNNPGIKEKLRTRLYESCEKLQIAHLNKEFSELDNLQYGVLKEVFSYLNQVDSRSAINKMDAKNLAIVIAPNLLPDMDINNSGRYMEDLKKMTDLVEMMITHNDKIFQK